MNFNVTGYMGNFVAVIRALQLRPLSLQTLKRGPIWAA